MPRPSLSVILANYNHSQYISEALAALIGQLEPDDELIVLDDASTDNSLDIIAPFVDNNPNVRLIRHATNQGVITMENEGFSEATKDYVYSASADDKILPGLFEKSLALLSTYPEAGLCSTLSNLMDESGRPLGPFETSKVLSEAGYI